MSLPTFLDGNDVTGPNLTAAFSQTSDDAFERAQLIVQGLAVENIAALRAYDISSTANGTAFTTLGYYDYGDGGGNNFYYSSGVASGTYTDNGGTIIVPSGVTDGSAAFVALNQRIVNARQFGAKGDTIELYDGAASTTTPTAFSSASASFTASDVGKSIIINGAGASGANLVTTIATYVDANDITLSTGVSTTVTNAEFRYGTNDFAAMTNANEALNSIGSGALYWDAGRYLSPNTLNSLIAYNTVEYYGDGDASFLDFTWNAFGSKQYLTSLSPFGRDAYPGMTYYAASDIAVGDDSVTATTPANAGNFAVGDIVMACSTAKIVNSSTDWEFYYVEINRVTGVNATTGVISLEHQIDDSCVGVQLANVTQWASCDFKIHDLKIKCDQTQGSHPYACALYYNAEIYNMHTEGAHIFEDNGFVRSVYRDSQGIAHITSTNTTPRVAEFATGSLRGVMRNLRAEFVNDDGTATASTWIPIIPDEFSRRCVIEDVSVSAPGIDCYYFLNLSTDGAHLIHNVRASLKSVSQIYRNTGYDSTAAAITSSITDKSTDVDGVHLQTQNGFTQGVVLSSASAPFKNHYTRNFTHSATNSFTPSASLYLIGQELGGRMAGISLEGNIVTGSPFATGSNHFLIENSEVQGFNTVASLNATNRRNLTRKGQEYVLTQTNADTHLQTTTANNKVTSFTLPANSLVFEGDYWDIQADILKSTGASAATVAIVVFGTTVATISIAAATATDISIRGRVFLSGGTGFTAPGTANVLGYYVLNGAVTNFSHNLTFTGTSSNEVDIEAWLASSGDNMDILGASITFVPVESR